VWFIGGLSVYHCLNKDTKIKSGSFTPCIL
jgi:hypothetical protein